MLGKFRNLLINCGITILAVVSLVGAVTSTLSWYSYNSKNIVSFHGTSIISNKQLQVGLLTDLDLSEYGFVTEEVLKPGCVAPEDDIPGSDEHNAVYEKIAWTAPGEGLTVQQVNAYLILMDYASSYLQPVTSGRFSTGQDEEVLIYNSPYDYNPNDPEEAPIGKYSKLPVCFRVVSQDSGVKKYYANKPIWISDATVNGGSNSGFNVADGVRVNFKSDNDINYILNPNSKSDGKTAVAGLLDLVADGYYDTDRFTDKEVIYGDYIGEPNYYYIEEDSDNVDINNTGKDDPYIFYSKHHAGKYVIDNYDDLDIGVQEYKCLKSVGPQVDPISGQFTGGMPVAITQDNCIGYSTISVWIEGWDLAVVNDIWNLDFSLGLTFEINRI